MTSRAFSLPGLLVRRSHIKRKSKEEKDMTNIKKQTRFLTLTLLAARV
jgi:hypothetical protein